MSNPILLTTAIVARRYSVSKRTIARWTADPKLDFPDCVKINGRTYWLRSDLEVWEAGRGRSSSFVA